MFEAVPVTVCTPTTSSSPSQNSRAVNLSHIPAWLRRTPHISPQSFTEEPVSGTPEADPGLAPTNPASHEFGRTVNFHLPIAHLFAHTSLLTMTDWERKCSIAYEGARYLGPCKSSQDMRGEEKGVQDVSFPFLLTTQLRRCSARNRKIGRDFPLSASGITHLSPTPRCTRDTASDVASQGFESEGLGLLREAAWSLSPLIFVAYLFGLPLKARPILLGPSSLSALRRLPQLTAL